MKINSFNPEFGYELICVLPYAYYLHETGALSETISAKGMEPYYYFSPNHKTNPEPRSWANTEKLLLSGMPNAYIHKSLKLFEQDRFSPPPYKQYFANNQFKFDKPILVISNKYNREWPGTPELNKPINFFSVTLLEMIFDKLQDKYQIIYINIDGEPDLCDIDNPPLTLGDFELLKNYPAILDIHVLKKAFNMTFNECQLKIFANCETFITTNGGGCILASYFGGKNIIYSKNTIFKNRSYPMEHQTGDWDYYHLFGGSEITVVTDYQSLLNKIIEL